MATTTRKRNLHDVYSQVDTHTHVRETRTKHGIALFVRTTRWNHDRALDDASQWFGFPLEIISDFEDDGNGVWIAEVGFEPAEPIDG
jgi:hypothetical protein